MIYLKVAFYTIVMAVALNAAQSAEIMSVGLVHFGFFLLALMLFQRTVQKEA